MAHVLIVATWAVALAAAAGLVEAAAQALWFRVGAGFQSAAGYRFHHGQYLSALDRLMVFADWLHDQWLLPLLLLAGAAGIAVSRAQRGAASVSLSAFVGCGVVLTFLGDAVLVVLAWTAQGSVLGSGTGLTMTEYRLARTADVAVSTVLCLGAVFLLVLAARTGGNIPGRAGRGE